MSISLVGLMGFFVVVLLAPVATADVLVVKLRAPMDQLPMDAPDAIFGEYVVSQAQRITPSFENVTDSVAAADFPADRYVTIRLRPEASVSAALAQLRGQALVESAEPDYELSDPGLVTEFNDPKIKNQWFLEQLRVPEAWDTTRGEGIFVADVESGFDTEHPDLKGRFDATKSYDYDPKTNDTSKVNDNKRSHGTPVCGLIGARAQNKQFGVGIAYEAMLIGSQMANSIGAHSEEPVWTVNTASAILGSMQRGASVILIEKQIPSLLSSVERIPVIYDAIKAAVAAGIPVVVPAGNFSTELKAEAKLGDSGSIFVAATTKSMSLAYFSNYGQRINVAAPGEEIYSVQEDSGETYDFGGTSSASAITAGIVALVRAANPYLSPREIRTLLVETGLPLEDRRKSLEAFSLVSRLRRAWDGEIEAKVGGTLVQAGPAVAEAVRRR